MFKIKDNNIYLNRGDNITIRLTCNTDFKENDKIKFSICKRGDYTNIVYQKFFTVTEAGPSFSLNLTSDETKIGAPIKNNTVIYWYEIELNEETTLVGYDDNGAKEFVLYPEATEV